MIRTAPECDLSNFRWGEIKFVHTLGSYTVVEYMEERHDNKRPRRLFHPYVNGKDMCMAEETLEAAFIFAFAAKKFAAKKLERNHAHHMLSAIKKILEIGSKSRIKR